MESESTVCVYIYMGVYIYIYDDQFLYTLAYTL